ncbi:hypothetical protein [Lentzea flava]|uniref:HEAT repeat-containing protein n=1 Tax=Lentzea flava TaxID=103732 RepID=A0ABQ2UIT3_9PSEU|nr:hypothetical protein [Lentzea flava]MCP2199980.1 hypothetical protein [Lentzea flava]GGU39550.1 hypothetical protein GCM10010178_34790 [Lentzea flava]
MDQVTPVSYPRLELLPTHEMPWEGLERLLRRIAQDVEGLRDVQLYGVRGQSQYGLDVVGTAPDGSRHGIQGKRYRTFTKLDLTKAVNKFISKRGNIPFPIARLVVAAGCLAERTEITHELYRLQDLHTDVQIELWHQRTISDKLRNRRDIVVELFSEAVADAFCLPAPLHVVAAPSPDRVTLADALLYGPAEITGAAQHLAGADNLSSTNPLSAVAELEQAAKLLAEGGFTAHATVVLDRRAALLTQADEHDKAARLQDSAFWSALEDGRHDDAETHARNPKKNANTAVSKTFSDIAAAAINIVRHPLGALPPQLEQLRTDSAELSFARLLILAAEDAAIDPSNTWRQDNLAALITQANLIEGSPSDGAVLACKLRLEVASLTGDWIGLLGKARKHQVPRDQAMLIYARNAMYHAERGESEQAEASWADAMTQACLNGQNGAAAEYVAARTFIRVRFRGPIAQNNDHQLVRSLRAQSPASTSAERFEEKAMRALLDDKPHVAVPLLRALHRAAYSAGAWVQLDRARRLLANAYGSAGESLLAVKLHVLGAQSKKAASVAKEDPNTYLDVREFLSSPAYWVAGTAYRVLAAEADLIPDNDVGFVTDSALSVLDDAAANKLQDGIYDSSVWRNAITALAALAKRLPDEHALRILEHSRPWVPREPGRHRRTDDDHVRLCAGIAFAHPVHRADAIDQLLGLLEANDSAVSRKTEHAMADLVQQHPEMVRERLARMTADGNPYAARLLLLITGQPTEEQLIAAAAAGERLRKPPTSTAHSLGIGTGAAGQALLARVLPSDERRELARHQLAHAAFPFEPGENRSEYYDAARILAHDLDDVDDLFDNAMLHAHNSTPSRGDILNNLGNHPLGMFRMTGFTVDTRAHALWLAALLARTDEQKQEVRALGYLLIGSTENADWYIAHAFQALDLADADHDLAFLASQPHWALRSLAAWIWTRSADAAASIGSLLTNDADPRVRCTFAEGASNSNNPATPDLREILLTDPCHSVRQCARQ